MCWSILQDGKGRLISAVSPNVKIVRGNSSRVGRVAVVSPGFRVEREVGLLI